MKRILFINIMCIMAAFVSAQSIKPQTATFEDYIPLLNQAGYQVYSFDISEFLNDTYQVTFKRSGEQSASWFCQSKND